MSNHMWDQMVRDAREYKKNECNDATDDAVLYAADRIETLSRQLREAETSRDSWIGMYKVAQERAETAFERAAQVAEEETGGTDDGSEFDRVWNAACHSCADAIRKLKEPSPTK